MAYPRRILEIVIHLSDLVFDQLAFDQLARDMRVDAELAALRSKVETLKYEVEALKISADRDNRPDGFIKLVRAAHRLNVTRDCLEKWCRRYSRKGIKPFEGFAAKKVAGLWWCKVD